MTKIIDKKTFALVGLISLVLLVLALSASDIISFGSLKGSVIGESTGPFEARTQSGHIGATIYLPTSITLIDQDSFFIPITVEGHRGTFTSFSAKAEFENTIVPGHYYSSFLKDNGSTLVGGTENITAAITNTPQENEALLRLTGTLPGDSGKIRFTMTLATQTEISTLPTVEITVKKGTAPTEP